MQELISVTVNGHPRQVSAGITIARLLTELERSPRGLAVERNGEIVPQEAFETQRLAPDDQLEIVSLVGGG